MAKEKALAKSKPSLINAFKINVLKHNSMYIDYTGEPRTLRYPPVKPYSDRVKKDLRELHLIGVPMVDDKSEPMDDLRNFPYLTKLTLGKGVRGISKHAIPSTVEELVLSRDVKSIPEGFVSHQAIHKVTGPDYTIESKPTDYKTDFFLDEFYRPNFRRNNRVSIGQEEWLLTHRMSLREGTNDARLAVASGILSHSVKYDNKKTLYAYGDQIDHELDYSVQIVADEFPMPEEHKKELADDHIIAIAIENEKELDFSTLDKYPNLRCIILGDKIKKVTGLPEISQDEFTREGFVKTFTRTLPNGLKQDIRLVSDDTLFVNTPSNDQEKEQVQEPKKESKKDREEEQK